GRATDAQLDANTIAVDGAGNLFVSGNSSVRKVSAEGTITTVFEFGGSLATDSAGNLVISRPSCNDNDQCEVIVQKLSTIGGVTTILEVPIIISKGQCTFPTAVAADGLGNLF